MKDAIGTALICACYFGIMIWLGIAAALSFAAGFVLCAVIAIYETGAQKRRASQQPAAGQGESA